MNSRTKVPSIDPRLAGDVIAFDHHDAATERPIVEGRLDRREVVGEPDVVRVETIRPVEPELLGGEVGVDLRLIISRYPRARRRGQAESRARPASDSGVGEDRGAGVADEPRSDHLPQAVYPGAQVGRQPAAGVEGQRAGGDHHDDDGAGLAEMGTSMPTKVVTPTAVRTLRPWS